MSIDHLKFAPDILRRLGEELISHAEQGIVELVRNSYDADAVNCRVELIETDEVGGTIRVTDDGMGMTRDAIRTGWLILGRSSKAQGGVTAKFGRSPVGEKGLGRLAALRLGRSVSLVTRPEQDGGKEYRVELNWADFENAETVDSVPINISEASTNACPGTIIEIRDLNARFTRSDVQRLARSLVLLSDPFENRSGFRPCLVSPTFNDLSRIVSDGYFIDAEYQLAATLNGDGHAEARVLDSRGQILFATGQGGLSETPYRSPSAKFELWVFILDKTIFSSRASTMMEVQEWLKIVGGVHLYYRELRVHPYGDSGNDWLEINLARARSPELRPSTNTTVGRIVVNDPNDLLIPKTDRSGFLDNEAFAELKRFALDALEWMAKERLNAREARRQTERSETPKNVKLAQQTVEKVVNQLPEDVRIVVESAVQKLERARERENRSLRDEIQLYRTLATVGTTAAVFAHEAAQPVTRIKKAAETIIEITDKGQTLFGEEMLMELAGVIIRSAQSIESFAGFTINLLRREKRRNGRIDVHKVIHEVVQLFSPFFIEAHIDVNLQLMDSQDPAILGSIAALESIFANLFTNAAYALIYAKPKPESCFIRITTIEERGKLIIRLLDNGPGIIDISLDQIWLPGRSTKERGTGLGMTIVRDAVIDLGGVIRALIRGELGGAEFIIELPLLGANR